MLKITRLITTFISQPKYLLMSGLITMVIAIIMLRSLTPLTPADKTDLTQKNYDQSISTFQLEYAGQIPTLPKALALGRIETKPVSEKELLNSIINKYELQPVEGDPFVWSSSEFVLVKDEGSGLYTLASQSPAQRSARLDEAAVLNQAESLVRQLFPRTPLAVIRSDTKYLAGSEEQKEVTANQAELIEPVFAPTLLNYPVLLKTNSQSLVQVVFDSQTNLNKLTFLTETGDLSITAQENPQTLISVDQAITNINRGNGAVIAADSRQVAGLNLNTRLSGNLNKVELEYRSHSDNLLVPYFRFSGQIQAAGIDLKADIITPAIDIKALPES